MATLRRARLGLVVLLFAPATLSAQTLRGALVDTSTEAPVGGATMLLVAPDSQRVASTLTDEGGAFSLTAPSPGEYMLRVERLGYDIAFVGPFELRAQGFVDITLALAPVAIPLDSLVVTTDIRQRALVLSGFFERKDRIPGHFLERAGIERIGAKVASDILVTVPGARIYRYAGMADVEMRGASLSAFAGQGGCMPTIYIDGILVSRQGPARPGGTMSMDPAAQPQRINLDDLQADDIEAIEVYSSMATVPAQYARDGGRCGLVLFWRVK